MTATPRDNTAFTPPTARQVADFLERHTLRGGWRWITLLPFVLLGLVAILLFASFGPLANLLPLVLVILILAGSSWRLRWMRALEARAVRVQELTMTRHYPQALRHAWRLLPDLRSQNEWHARTVIAMAHCLDRCGAFEAAIAAYDFLIQRLPQDHPGAVHLNIQRAMAQLLTDRLADADDALRRMRGSADAHPGTPISAGLRLAQLAQQVRTNHFIEAVQQPGDLVQELRPLGVDAGFGYALMALAHHRVVPDGSERPPDQPTVDDAVQWWRRATLLLPPSALMARFEELGQFADLPVAAMPWPEAL